MFESFTKILFLFAGRDVKCSLDVKWPGPLKMCTKINEKRNKKLNFCSKFISNSRSKGTSTDQEAFKILKARRNMILSYEIHLIHFVKMRRYHWSMSAGNVVVILKERKSYTGPSINIIKMHACKVLPLTVNCPSPKADWPPGLVLRPAVVKVPEGDLLGLLLGSIATRLIARVILWIRWPKNTEMMFTINSSLCVNCRLPDSSSPPPNPDGTEHRHPDKNHQCCRPGHRHQDVISICIVCDRHNGKLSAVVTWRDNGDVSDRAIVLTLMKRYVRPQTNDQCIRKLKEAEVDSLSIVSHEFTHLKLYFLNVTTSW